MSEFLKLLFNYEDTVTLGDILAILSPIAVSVTVGIGIWCLRRRQNRSPLKLYLRRDHKLTKGEIKLGNVETVIIRMIPKVNLSLEWLNVRPVNKKWLKRDNQSIASIGKFVIHHWQSSRIKVKDDGNNGKQLILLGIPLNLVAGEAFDLELSIQAEENWKGEISIQVPTPKGHGFARRQITYEVNS